MQQQPTTLSIYTWGLGADYSLGTSTQNSLAIPTPIIKSHFLSISSGAYTSAATTADGTVYLWGKNKHSRLGFKNQDFIKCPSKVQLAEPISQVACGAWHTLLLSSKGTVFATGYNKTGCLGLNHTEDACSFTPLAMTSQIKSISAGQHFSLFLDDEGQIHSCGHRSYVGQITKGNILSPNKIDFPETGPVFVSINCGFVHCGAIDSQGRLFTWGANDDYQLGTGNNQHHQRPTLIQVAVPLIQVSCSRGEKNCHTGAVAQDGSVLTWGGVYKGKLGHKENWTHADQKYQKSPKTIEHFTENNIRAKLIQCGGIHTIVLDDQGQLHSFGCGSDGRLGHAESDEHTYLYKEGYPRRIDAFTGKVVKDLSCSYYHNVCLVQD